MKAFAGMAQAAAVTNALDAKTKELIALGIAVAARYDDRIAFHARLRSSRVPRRRKFSRHSA